MKIASLHRKAQVREGGGPDDLGVYKPLCLGLFKFDISQKNLKRFPKESQLIERPYHIIWK
jgi:hypothetical protein